MASEWLDRGRDEKHAGGGDLAGASDTDPVAASDTTAVFGDASDGVSAPTDEHRPATGAADLKTHGLRPQPLALSYSASRPADASFEGAGGSRQRWWTSKRASSLVDADETGRRPDLAPHDSISAGGRSAGTDAASQKIQCSGCLQWSLILREVEEELESVVICVQTHRKLMQRVDAQPSDASSSATTALRSTPKEERLSYDHFYHAMWTPVPLKQVELAKRCEQLRRHRVGRYFLLDTDGQGQPEESSWRWADKLRGRGMSGLGRAGIWLGFRQKYFTFWFRGHRTCIAQVMCNICKTMHLAKTVKRHFTEQDDQEMLDFFMYKKIEKTPAGHPHEW